MRGEYFEAHEYWESVWLMLREPEKSFLQALIQVTAAFHHLAAGNRAGTESLLERAQRRLENCPPCFGGIKVAPLLTEISAWLQWLEKDAPVCPAHPKIRPADSNPK
jgi:predicted metal-dependent hydrolase